MPLLDRWTEEREAVWLYGEVARAERDPDKSRLFEALAKAAAGQAAIIEEAIRKGGGRPPATFTPSLRARLVARLALALGPRRVRPILAAMKVRGLAVYSAPPPRTGHPMPSSVDEIGLRHHRAGGATNLRAAVFGANDGLVSNTSLILGVAGATSAPDVILLSGTAGLLAGAFSMAAGEYVSVRSQRELYEHQIAIEREELEQYPEEEAEELALIYNARGVPLEQARRMAGTVFGDHEQALRTLALEELGVNPDELGSPAQAAVASFLSFAGGAVVPLLPFLVGRGTGRLETVACVSAAALFAVGAAISLFSGRSAWLSGLRMLAIGAAAAITTFAIGRLLGTSLAGL